jgi:hypothetical protein
MNKLKRIVSKLFTKKHSTNLNSSKSFEEIYEDLGCFKYDKNGFTIVYEETNIAVKWEEITQLNAYKKDLIAIDRIEMEIVCGEKYFVINEELPGWFQFVIKTKEVFPTIPKDWDLHIIHPAFQTNFTIIYSKI